MRDLLHLRTELYPPLEPFERGSLRLDSLHTMYWEQSGNPEGVPVLYLHGGPGGGSNPRMRQFFDPAHYRIVVYDQRGAGRSVPSGDTRDNTTTLLIRDIERLRVLLGVDRWLVFGGSWGATLALAYGQTFPERVLGFILRGVFLGEKAEIDWFLHGMRHVFPEAWEDLVAPVPAGQRHDLARWYHERLQNPDPAVHLPLARTWSRYEAACSTLLPNNHVLTRAENDQAALAIARIEAHYFVNDVFLVEGELLANVGRVAHLPAVLVQGRYDMICPPVTADRLARAWPDAHLVMVPDAGHSVWEPGITAELVRATELMKRRLASA